MALTSKSQTWQSIAGSALRATMRLSLLKLNLSLLNSSKNEDVERTFRMIIHANEDDDHLVQSGAVILIT
jgi:hypothetical protein